jgi:hypothetical protein
MYKAFYAQLTFAWLPQVVTLFFFAVFLIALARLFVFRRGKDVESIAAMPLKDEERHG